MKGFVNLYKPVGMSSSQAVGKVKRALYLATGEKQKVGHFGTLDPEASGVLPIAVGNATRLFDFAQEKVKVYQATFKFGIETDTLDRAGQVVATDDKIVSYEQIHDVLNEFKGKITQIPPAYSAKSVGGRRAYDLARAGISVDLKPKEVEIFDFKLIRQNDGFVSLQDGKHRLEKNEFAFEIACSSGTYIRSLARDLARALGTVGYMSSLLRVQSGVFELGNAVIIEDFETNPLEYIHTIDFALAKFDVFDLPQETAAKVLNGVQVFFKDLPSDTFVVKLNSEIVGIAQNDQGKLKFKTRL